MQSEIHVIRTGVLGVNTLVVPICQNKVFIVDPAACSLSRDETKIIDYLHNHKLECVAILLTHSHFDHIMGMAKLKEKFPHIKIAIHEEEFAEVQNNPGPMNNSVVRFFGALEMLNELAEQPAADLSFKDGDTLSLLSDSDELKNELQHWKVIHTPGHTPGSSCFYNAAQKILISGDTLFDYGGYGRTDMAGGDEVKIIHSLELLRNTIPAGTKVYPGHDSFGFLM